MLNITVSTAILPDYNGNTSFVFDTTALNSFSLDYQNEIDAGSSDGGVFDVALNNAPTSISSTEIIWGAGGDTVTLSGSGFGPISSASEFFSAIDEATAKGNLNEISFVTGGVEILNMSWGPSGIVFQSGDQSFSLNGDMPESFDAIFGILEGWADLSANGFDQATLDTYQDFFEYHSFTGITIRDADEVVLDLDLDSNGFSFSAGNLELNIDGTFPTNTLAELISTVAAITSDVDGINLDDYPSLGVDGLTLSDTDGNVLVSVTGEVTDETSVQVNTVTFNGTDGADEIQDTEFDGAQLVQINAGDGDDDINVNLSDSANSIVWGFPDDTSPVSVDGGAGYDSLDIVDHGSSLVEISFADGTVEGFAVPFFGPTSEAFQAYALDFTNIERIEIYGTGHFDVTGGDSDDSLVIGYLGDYGTLSFDGGDGNDILEIHRTDVFVNDQWQYGFTYESFLANFTITENSDGVITVANLAGETVATISNVEQVRFATFNGGTEIATIQEILDGIRDPNGDASDNVIWGTGDVDTISGFAGQDELFGLGGDDALYGGDGDDELDGGAGNDFLDGGDGWDEVNYDEDEFNGATSGINANLTTGVVTDGFGNTDTLVSIEEVDGTSFADVLIGANSGGSDLNGRDGDDILTASTGAEWTELDAGAGNDILNGADDGYTMFNGGAGNDLFYGGDGYSDIRYDHEEYSILQGVVLNTVTGTATDTFGDTDTFENMDGVVATSMADTVTTGDDEFNAILGDGDDVFFGGTGRNYVAGGAGNDTLVGGDGDEFDELTYKRDESNGATQGIVADMAAGTVIDGFGDTDTVSGWEAISATNFDDTITSGVDGLYAQLGGGTDIFNGSADGFDHLDYRWDRDSNGDYAQNGITVTLVDGSGTIIDNFGDTDTVTNVDMVSGSHGNDTVTIKGTALFGFRGGDGDDTVFGGDGVNGLYGEAGNDRLYGGKGNDSVFGGDGDDYVKAGGGQEEFYGGDGHDYISYYSSSNGVTVNLETNEVSGSWAANDTISGFESVTGSKTGNDKIYGTSGANTIKTYGGDDRVYAGKGTDKVYLGDGDDYVRVGGGREEFYGGDGHDYISYYSSSNGVTVNLGTNEVSGSWAANDTISGFESVTGSKTGNDKIYGTSGANTIKTYGGDDRVYAGKGTDKVYLGDGDDYVRVGGGKEEFYGGDGHDYISYYSSSNGIIIDLAADKVSGSWAVNDTISGFESAAGSKTGHDTMAGTSGSNTLKGFGGNDKLYGRGGDDKLYGGDGEDRFDGGAGTDLLYGGADADIFHLDHGEGHDIIKDFQDDVDTIELDNFTFAEGQDAFDFATQAGDDVVFDFGNGDMLTVENATIGQLYNDLELV